MYHDQSIRDMARAQMVSPSEMAEKQRAAEYEHRQQQKVNAILAASPVRVSSTLELALDSMGDGVSEAFAALDRLSARMEPVLQPEIPTPVGAGTGTNQTEAPRSMTVRRLHDLRTQLEVLTSRINSLNGRLDT